MIAQERGHHAVVLAITSWSPAQNHVPVIVMPPAPALVEPEPEPEPEPGLGPAGLISTSSATLIKFTGAANCMILGEPKEAADGICALLGITRTREIEILNHPIQSMASEFRELNAAASAVFAQHNNVGLLDGLKKRTTANLESYHVLALRLYTTELYSAINEPLRLRKMPHPLAATVRHLCARTCAACCFVLTTWSSAVATRCTSSATASGSCALNPRANRCKRSGAGSGMCRFRSS